MSDCDDPNRATSVTIDVEGDVTKRVAYDLQFALESAMRDCGDVSIEDLVRIILSGELPRQYAMYIDAVLYENLIQAAQALRQRVLPLENEREGESTDGAT